MAGATIAPGGSGPEGVALATLNVRLVTIVPFLMVTSFFSTSMETTSTDSTRSPSARMGLIICLPGPGMISNKARLLERILVIPVNSTVAGGAGGTTGVALGSSGGGGGFSANGLRSTITS